MTQNLNIQIHAKNISLKPNSIKYLWNIVQWKILKWIYIKVPKKITFIYTHVHFCEAQFVPWSELQEIF